MAEDEADGITDSTDMNLSKLWDIVEYRRSGVLQSMELQRVGDNLATEQQPHSSENPES